MGRQNTASTLEGGLTVSHKTQHTLTILSSSGAPCYLPKGVENLVFHKACAQMFIAALFIIAQTWRQPRPLLVS